MSDGTLDNLKNELVQGAKKAIYDLVASTLAGAKGDVKAFGQLLAQEYAKYLWRTYTQDDEMARRNLKHLKAQALEIAVRRELVIAHEDMQKFLTGLEWAGQTALRMLIAAAVAA